MGSLLARKPDQGKIKPFYGGPFGLMGMINMMRRLQITRCKGFILLLLAVLILGGCTYLFPAGGWETPSDTKPEPRQEPSQPAAPPSPATDRQIYQAKQQMFQILKKINSQHAVRVGGTLKLRMLPTGQLLQNDPWGTPFCLLPEIPAQTEPVAVKARFWLVSAGPDRLFGTLDDIRMEGEALTLETPKVIGHR